MPTLKKIVSDLSDDIKALNIDDRFSYRFLASKFKDKIQVFIRQDARSRELLKESNIWKPINCVNLTDANTIDCDCIEDDCQLIKKSVIQIPDAYSTTYGNLIKVFTLDGTQEYKEIHAYQHPDKATREYGSGKYFWLENGYLFIPNVSYKAVKVLIIAKSPQQIDIINGTVSKCSTPLDEELNYPAYLITVAKTEVLKELSGVTARVVPDEKPNENQNLK